MDFIVTTPFDLVYGWLDGWILYWEYFPTFPISDLPLPLHRFDTIINGYSEYKITSIQHLILKHFGKHFQDDTQLMATQDTSILTPSLVDLKIIFIHFHYNSFVFIHFPVSFIEWIFLLIFSWTKKKKMLKNKRIRNNFCMTNGWLCFSVIIS